MIRQLQWFSKVIFLTIDILANILGFIGLIAGIASFQFKSGQNIFKIQMGMNVFWAIHYFLLGGYVGALMSTVAIFRSAAGWRLPPAHLVKVAIMSSLCSAVLGVASAQSLIHLTATMGSIINHMSITVRDKPILLRTAQFIGEACWLVYCITIASYPGIAFGIFLLSSNVIGALRHEKDAIREFCQKTRQNQ